MPKKKVDVRLPGNSNKQEVHKKVANRMKDCNAFVFLSIKDREISSAFSIDGATPDQILYLSKILNDEALKLIILADNTLQKYENENLGKTAPRGVS